MPIIRERSRLHSNSRKLAYISPEEMNLAIVRVIENSIAIHCDNAVPLIAKVFGFTRVTEDMRKSILGSIDYAISHKAIIKDDEFLKLI